MICKVDSDNFTTIIPAAGRGSRLNCSRDKLNLEILGKSLLEWVLSLVANVSKRVIIIHSTEVNIPRDLLQKYTVNISLIQQSYPYGTAHAVRMACRDINTRFTNVIWVDQITLLYSNLLRCLKYAQVNDQHSLIFPVVYMENPYVHFQITREGKITRVLYKRENDIMPSFGLKDAGFFIFSTEILKEVLDVEEYYNATLGKHTAEYNLLSVFPILENYGKGVKMLKIISYEESQDVNTDRDVATVTNIIKRRKLC